MRVRRRVVAVAVAAAVGTAGCGSSPDPLVEALAVLPVTDELPYVVFARPAAGLEVFGGDDVPGDDAPGDDDAEGEAVRRLLLAGVLIGDHTFGQSHVRGAEPGTELARKRGFGVADVELLVSSLGGDAVDVVVGPDPDAVREAGRAAAASGADGPDATRWTFEDGVRETVVVGDGHVWVTLADPVTLPPRAGATVADLPGVAELAQAVADEELLAGTLLLADALAGQGDIAWSAAAFGRAADDDLVVTVAVHEDADAAAATEARFRDPEAVRGTFGRDAEILEVRRDGTTVVLHARSEADRHPAPLQRFTFDVLLPAD